MALDGAVAEGELLGNLAVAEATREECEDLDLPDREPSEGRGRAGRGRWNRGLSRLRGGRGNEVPNGLHELLDVVGQ